ncbi:unnamed protein product, partial [Allacma fusca]
MANEGDPVEEGLGPKSNSRAQIFAAVAICY